MAQRLLHRLVLAISFDNPNGTATVTQTSFGNLFWQSQWHSNCYTDFFWQFLLTIQMAQRLLHKLLLAISCDNPNGTATVTQTNFGNFFWQSKWHSDCYTNFFWQFLVTIPMAQQLLHRLILAISFDNPNAHESAKATKVLRTTAKNATWIIAGYEKIIKLLWAHRLITKAQRMQMKVQKQRKYCAQQQQW